MEIKHLMTILRRWWWMMLAFALVGGAIAYFLTPTPPPVYQASTTVLISQGSNAVPSEGDVSAGQRLASTYSQLISARPILEEVIQNLNLDITSETLAAQIRVSDISNTNLLVLTVQDGDPQRAADIANEVVRVFIQRNQEIQASRYSASKEGLQNEIAAIQDEIVQLQTNIEQLQANIDEAAARIDDINERESNLPAGAALPPEQVAERNQLEEQINEWIAERNRLEIVLTQYQTRYSTLLSSFEGVRLAEAEAIDFMSVLEEAQTGKLTSPAPKKLVNALQAALVGLILGGGLAFLIENLRESVSTSEDVEKLTGFPTLGVIANIRGDKASDKLVTVRHPRAPVAEAYRVLRANLEFSLEDSPIHAIVVTSSSPVEGKTTTAANLAVAIAQSGKRVILVDADLRRPTTHKLFEQTNTRGVTTALVQDGTDSVGDHMVATGIDNLYLMPSGPLPPNPADILGSARMAELITKLKSYADVIIVDTPPLLAMADATLLARACDATLLVVKADSTRPDLLRRARDQLLQSGTNVLGVVLNRVAETRDGYYYAYEYYSSAE